MNTFSIVGTALGGDLGSHDALITVNTVDGSGAIQSVSITGTANNVSDGLEANSAQWELVLTGISYVGDYARGTRYKPNEIVRWSPGMLSLIHISEPTRPY